MSVVLGEDTIAAIATGMGEAGVGVVRVSGPNAIAVGSQAFRPRKGGNLATRRSHTVTYGWVVDGQGKVVDEALALIMRGPHSFTGEDVVELHGHGGQVAVRRVLEAALAAGARLAEPGEFTKRAFLNGRIDLTQAEAVIDVIRAKTDSAMAVAVTHLRGELGDLVRRVRRRLLETIAHLEADIDFPELDLEVQTRDETVGACQWALAELRRALRGARQGRLVREGLRAVLVGRPNVGKSSLLNRLVHENRAIVTPIPGTTRDVIEEWMNLGGMPVLLSDTAGIRETEDVVERVGVERSRSQIERSDLIIMVIDAAAGVTADDLAVIRNLPQGKRLIGVVNKVDLAPGFDLGLLSDPLGGVAVYGVSAETGAGLDGLEQAIAGVAGQVDPEQSLVANARQEEALRQAVSFLEEALRTSAAGAGSDLVSISVRSAWVGLGEVIGETVGEDLLDQIFSQFCIGK